MFLSILKKNNLYILYSILFATTSCSSKFCSYEETIEIPCDWQTPIDQGITKEDPADFLWWEALEDPLLTTLVEQGACRNKDVHLAAAQSKEKLLETIHSVTSEIAKSYLELRSLQMRSKVLQASIQAQKELIVLNEGLSTKGFFSLIDQNENKKMLDALQVQNAEIEASIRKTIYHLSSLLGYPPGGLYDTLCPPQKLPELPRDIPVGFPMELIERNPAVREAKKTYEATKNKQAFYNYQKTVLSSLEAVENALAEFHVELDKNYYSDSVKRLKADAYELTKDLYNQGLKDDRDVLKAYQEFLFEENAFIQSKTELLRSYASLYEVLGVGWEVPCIN